jgi:integrase
MSALSQNFAAPIWMMYRQVTELNGHVRKGEKGSLVYANAITRTERDLETGEDIALEIPYMKGYAAYSFGFRKGELLNLRVRQVDLMERLIQLEEGTTKNNEARKVFMTEEVFQLMRECVRDKKPEGFVFTRESGERVVDPRDEWYSLCVSSGLGKYELAKRRNGKEYQRHSGLNLHDFRRSAIRNMTRRGVNDTTAMKISGHKTRSVFMRYNIVDERDLAEAARKIEAGRQVDFKRSKSDTKVTHERVAHS